MNIKGMLVTVFFKRLLHEYNPALNTEERLKFFDKLADDFISALHAEVMKALPDKLEEYTDDYNLTHGVYSHTEKGKRYFDIEENQGFNQAIDEVKANLEQLFKKEE